MNRFFIILFYLKNLLNLKFEEEKDVLVYHEEVKLVNFCYKIFHTNENNGFFKYKVADKSINKCIGHFYTDLHPRDGKYSNPAVFDIIVKYFKYFKYLHLILYQTF